MELARSYEIPWPVAAVAWTRYMTKCSSCVLNNTIQPEIFGRMYVRGVGSFVIRSLCSILKAQRNHLTFARQKHGTQHFVLVWQVIKFSKWKSSRNAPTKYSENHGGEREKEREIKVSAEVHGERVEHVHSVSGREFRMVTQNAAWSWETWQTRCVVQDELSERETSEHRLQWLYQQTDVAAGFIAAKSMAKWWICSIQNLSRGQYLDAILRSCTRARVSLYLSPALSATY